MSTTRISRLGFKAAENGRFDIMKSIYRKVPHQVRAYICLLYTSPSPRDCS